MRWLQRLWARITEPRRMKVFYFFVYLLTAGVGLVTLLSPPRSIAWELGRVRMDGDPMIRHRRRARWSWTVIIPVIIMIVCILLLVGMIGTLAAGVN